MAPEPLPLTGARVVVTRGASQASALSELLAAKGALPVAFATIGIEQATDGGSALRAAMADLDSYDWVVLTSVNGVEACVAAGVTAGAKFAAVGQRTSDALEAAGLPVAFTPSKFTAGTLVDEFRTGSGLVLYPCGALAADTITTGLSAKGWRVDRVEAYRTVDVEQPASALEAVRSADIITFASASSVARFCALAGADAVPDHVVCIGPVTAARATELGISVDRVADPHTIEALVDAVVAEWDDRTHQPPTST